MKTFISLSLALALSAFAFAVPAKAGHEPGHDTCELGAGNEAGDIYNLVATYDLANDLIVVEMLLCGTSDNKLKYRVHFDHTAPFFNEDDRNGDEVVDAGDFCFTTSDDMMKRRGNKRNTGPGSIVVSTTNVADDTLTYTVPVDELNPALVLGDTVYIWANTQYKGSIDWAPDTDELGDSCSKPEVETEVVALTLEPPEKIVFVTSSTHSGNLGGLAGADAICNNLAAAASLTGNFLAWLSDSSSSPSTRFTKSSVPYKLVNGTKVADNWADLTDGSLDAPINRTEQNVVTTATVWTGTASSGVAFHSGYGAPFCGDWTIGTDEAGSLGGKSWESWAAWTYGFSNANCGMLETHIYCFEK